MVCCPKDIGYLHKVVLVLTFLLQGMRTDGMYKNVVIVRLPHDQPVIVRMVTPHLGRVINSRIRG